MPFAEPKINQSIYDSLDEQWYDAKDNPVALLRLESKLRNPWIQSEISRAFGSKKVSILDLGCGAGFLTNYLAERGHNVVGLDLSQQSLNVAAKHDSTGKVKYLCSDVFESPLKDESFDVVCATDFLEHVDEPEKLIRQASRLLRKSGLFFFHTFNRNPLSWLIVIKGVEWFVKNTPENLHLYSMFIKPRELAGFCSNASMDIEMMKGVRPKISWSFWKMLATRSVPNELEFKFCSSLATGYCGFARKKVS